MNVSNMVYRLFVQQTRSISIFSLSIMILMVLIIYSVILYFVSKKKKISVLSAVSGGLFLIYLCFLVHITLLSREQGSRSSTHNSYDIDFSVTKFVMILKYLVNPNQSELLQMGWFSAQQVIYDFFNTLLFIPHGVILTLILKDGKPLKRIVMCACYAFLTTVAIECLQWKLGRGYFEARDILLNFLGGITGCFICNLFLGLIYFFRHHDRKRKMNI